MIKAIFFEDLQEGMIVRFACNGRGRGGHCSVTARVDKINRKTFNATEVDGSYQPGKLWNVHSSVYLTTIC